MVIREGKSWQNNVGDTKESFESSSRRVPSLKGRFFNLIADWFMSHESGPNAAVPSLEAALGMVAP